MAPAAAAASAASTEGSSGEQPSPAVVPATPRAAPASNELNGLALLWGVLKDWLRGLFAGKKA